jgi:hypothetical protein
MGSHVQLMKNIFSIIICFTFVVPAVVIGNSEYSEGGIYFCHRDADFTPDVFRKEERDVEDDLSNTEVRNISIGLAKSGFYARHCFFLLALDKAQEYKQQNKILIAKSGMESAGYGKIGKIAKEVGGGGEEESYLHAKPLSCVVIIEDNDDNIKLVENLLLEAENELYASWKELVENHQLDEIEFPKLLMIWQLILDLVHHNNPSKDKYNAISNNCCTLSYKVAELLIGEDEALANRSR